MIVIALLLLVISTFTLAQKPTPCDTPPQWEGRVFRYDEEVQFYGRGFFSYDSLYQRDRFIEEYTLQSDTEVFDTLRIFSAKTQYKFNLRTKECTKQAITQPWSNFAIPQNATFFGYNYLGSSAVPNANLLTQVWGYNFTDNQGNPAQYTGVYTNTACIPVHSTEVYIKDTLHNSFFDITPGISNPSQFIPRPECLQEEDDE